MVAVCTVLQASGKSLPPGELESVSLLGQQRAHAIPSTRPLVALSG